MRKNILKFSTRMNTNITNDTNVICPNVSSFATFNKFVQFVILLFAMILVACSGPPGGIGESPKNDLELARQVLVQYFKLLHAGRYFEASHFYGGSYDVLQEWNPSVVSSDHATLFQLGCEQNGLMCLEISNFISTEELPNGYRFTVEFVRDDGELLVIGECCGDSEDSIPAQSHFKFTVLEAGEGYLVQELPVYMP